MLLAGVAPAPAGPQDVGAQALDLRAALAGNDVEGKVGAREVGQRARLEQDAGPLDRGRKLRQPRRLDRLQRRLRLAVHEPDRREPRRDGCPGSAGQAVLDLMPEQIAGLIEKVELDQTVGQPANDLVAAAADRGELLEIEIERERIDAGEGLAFSREEQILEEAPGIFVQRA